MAWLALVVAGLLEVAWAMALPETRGFTRPLPSMLFVALLAGSMLGLAYATKTLPIGTAYAIWVGIGAVGTVLTGIVVRGDQASTSQLIALCAPRPTFISYGIPERGDAKWLDQQGSFMAAIAAQRVFTLLGAKGLGRSDDYRTEKMPPVNEGLLDGQLAWRQHDGGHTDGPNWKHFIPWAGRQLGR